MRFSYNFHDGPFLEYVGDETDPPVFVEFEDLDKKQVTYTTTLFPNCWAKGSPKFYRRWQLRASVDGTNVFTHTLDLNKKRVMVEYPYSTLGDFLLWMPVIEKFRVEHNCIMIVESKRYIDVVKQSYPEIVFTSSRDPIIDHGIYSFYYPTLVDYDAFFCDNKWPKYDTVQQAACALFGLKNTYLTPKIDSTDIRPDIKQPYICITEHGQSNAEKQWLYPGGWQKVAEFLVESGFTVVTISSEPSNISGKGIINKTGIPLVEMIQYIKYAKALLGSPTGPLVISTALNVLTIRIATNVWPEEGAYYIYNHDPDYCFGCYTKGPMTSKTTSCDKRTNGIPECSMMLTPDYVINNIKDIFEKENI